MRRMSSSEFHEAAVLGCRSLHQQGKLTDAEMAEQEAWWARGGHLDDDGETSTWIWGA